MKLAYNTTAKLYELEAIDPLYRFSPSKKPLFLVMLAVKTNFVQETYLAR